ncbi:MAG: CBS domain-containing protein [Chloroflexi bacterium]|nr:CBS domain-containing protein [Chloroflexota bacterium]
MSGPHLILTREEPDFDAVAALVAAGKRFPHALIHPPKKLPPPVRAFLHTHEELLPPSSRAPLPPSPSRITLVATHRPPPPLEETEAPVHIIHRTPPPEPLPEGWTFEGGRVGATTTLLVEHLREQNTPLTRAEATLLALGIYQATDAFTSPHTTPRDTRAVTWLLEQGADVDEIRAHLPLATSPPVRDIMSYNPQTLPPDTRVEDAVVHMRRYGLEGIPVVHPRTHQFLGLITRWDVERAVHHGLGEKPVADIMNTGPYRVTPEEGVSQVQRLMAQSRWGQIPVVDDTGRLVGLVTRSDLLRLWLPEEDRLPREDIARRLEEALPAALLDLLHIISHEAAQESLPLYVVGGVVRDLFLGMPNWDVDLVVEGDAIRLARRLARRYGGDVRSHPRFGTAKWILPQDAPFRGRGVPPTLDLVTARAEFYEHPAALPTVTPGSITRDLQRRDFTINTLAIRLDEPYWGELLNLFGGLRDLRQGVIRVLHPLSFVEDPTRILRAVRFEQRFRFRLDQRTEDLLREARPFLDRVSGARVAHEFALIFQEAEPERALRRLDTLEVLPHIHPLLRFPAETAERFRRLREAIRKLPVSEPLEHLYMALWLYEIPPEHLPDVAQRLELRREVRRLLEDVAALRETLDVLTERDIPPSAFVRAVERYRPEALLLVAVVEDDPHLWERLTSYLEQWRSVRPHITGEDLQEKYGLPPGPRVGELLRRLRDAHVDGLIRTREEEDQLLRSWLEA